MSRRDDGEAAFPCVHDKHLQEGMSLRDYFAAQALAGILSHPDTHQADGLDETRAWGVVAEQAYAAARAMLAERAKP